MMCDKLTRFSCKISLLHFVVSSKTTTTTTISFHFEPIFAFFLFFLNFDEIYSLILNQITLFNLNQIDYVQLQENKNFFQTKISQNSSINFKSNQINLYHRKL